MAGTSPADDPMWPRAGQWIVPADPEGVGSAAAAGPCDLVLIGVPAHETSITPTRADTTPAAVRDALLRYSTWSASSGVDVAGLRAVDFGDVEVPDGPAGEARVRAAVQAAAEGARLVVALGGDNSITFPVMSGLFGEIMARGDCGLVTIDAHHDLRDGVSNGSTVRRLIEEGGLPGRCVVQVGIGDFSNSPEYAERARELDITTISRAVLRRRGMEKGMGLALDIAGADGRPVFVDIDVDVCDRAAVPGCPSSAPGGLSADELRHAAFLLGVDPRVRGFDITEIDASIDAPDGRTVRLAALLVLEAAAGLASR
jgi:formiminoglutamase